MSVGRFAASSQAMFRRSIINGAIFGVAARGNWANGGGTVVSKTSTAEMSGDKRISRTVYRYL